MIGYVAYDTYFFSAVFSNNRQLITMSIFLDNIVDVDIDHHGKFKYVLVDVYDEDADVSKFIVRGYASANLHRK